MTDIQEKLLPLYSHNGEHEGTITLGRALREAQAGEMELRWKGQGRKSRITAVYRIFTKPFKASPSVITAKETENFAFVHNGARLSEKDAIRTFEQAVSKVAAWPEIHDSKAVVISAGMVYGVFCPFPPLDPSHIVTFA